MYTLILTCGLGLLCMVGEILNLRRLLIPVIILGLGGIFLINFQTPEHLNSYIMWGVDMSHMMGSDSFSVGFNGLLIGIALIIFVLAADFYKKEPNYLSDYLAIILFILGGAIVLTGFVNLVMFFLGIEIVSISLYVLAGSRKHDVHSNEAGFKYFLMGSFASAIMLFGIALVYGASDSFALDAISAFALAEGASSPLFLVGTMLIMISLLFKVAAVPFHFWSPDVYEGSPTLVTALMATLVKISFFTATYRLMSHGFRGVESYTNDILIWITAATMIAGNLLALGQQNFKRLLAYSGISHAGFMLLAILSIPSDSSSALFYYGIAYGLATLGAFAVAIPIFSYTGKETIDAFDGLGKKKPLLAALLTMSMLSLAGIPPLAGFMAKYYIFSEAVKNGYLALTLIAVLVSIVGVYYYFKVILAMYTKPADEMEIKLPVLYWVVLVMCVALSVVWGIFPGFLIRLL